MQFESSEKISISNWKEYLNKIEELNSDWIFRAQESLDKIENNNNKSEIIVQSSFDKACALREKAIPGDKRWKYEARILFEFKRGAQRYLDQLPAKNDFLEWMALGRHYGMPSRLVDFTYSPYVAAYFALSKKKEKEKGYIIALNITWMKEDIEKNIENNKWKEWMSPVNMSPVKKEEASFHNPEFFRRFAFESKENYAVPVGPVARNPRLAAQQGLFLCPGNIAETFDVNLGETLKRKKVIKLFILEPGMHQEAIRELWKMNINLATLYQDLSGWAETQRDWARVWDEKDKDERLIQELKISISERPYN
ncbi:MAG: FRG domain-containing protein [Candidatus Omnitrophota bacterium]|jgi:hypothetical protein